MSIESLKDRFNQSLRHFSSDKQVLHQFAKPQRLIKRLDSIERKFDEIENTQPLEAKIVNSLSKLERHGFDALSKRDWKNLAWSLSKTLLNYEEKILFTFVGSQLLGHFSKMSPEQLSGVYFPLLYGYFAVKQTEIDKRPNNWIELRYILNTQRSMVLQTTNRPKKWLITLTDYPELLTIEPCKTFIRDFLQDMDDSKISTQLVHLNIAPNSWFWDNLMQSAITSIKTMSEDDYFKMIPRFLWLLEKNQLYTTAILAALLERYAVTSKRPIVHEDLKRSSLSQWNSPQFESSAGWRNVNADTKKMVIQWFVRADLEAFFRLFSHTADAKRFDYWIKFIDNISFSQIFLGSAALQSRQFERRTFIERNQSRLKNLVGSTATNNAFLLKIDNIYIVDFSDTGNACYGYFELPFNMNKRDITVSDLKNKPLSIFKNGFGEVTALSHSGDWEARFDEKLAELGIFCNRPNSSAYKKHR